MPVDILYGHLIVSCESVFTHFRHNRLQTRIFELRRLEAVIIYLCLTNVDHKNLEEFLF